MASVRCTPNELSSLISQQARLAAEDIDRLPTFAFREPAVGYACIADATCSLGWRH
jgi:hypothetical protein